MIMTTTGAALACASAADTARVVLRVLVPMVARGAIIRRRPVVTLLARIDGDAKAVRLLAGLRSRYGDGPLRLRLPGRTMALVLSARDAETTLSDTERFRPANREKRAALRHFQPHGVLVSPPEARPPRRRFTEAVLETGRPVHAMADRFAGAVEQELAGLPARLDWDTFSVAWWRAVRRITLGDPARDDDALTDLLASLRRDANWAFARRRRARTGERFRRHVRRYLDAAEPGSLAALATEPAADLATPDDAVDQFAHWLFAFDAGGIAVFQALGLLAVHPQQRSVATTECADHRGRPAELPYLRACLLEAVRLWPTTPVILRDAAADTVLTGAVLPAGTALVIFAPLLHRDPAVLPYADRFEPDAWLTGDAVDSWSVLPFSAGPASCPGRELVLLAASTALATVLSGHEVRPDGTALSRTEPLPGTLDPFRLRFALSKR